VENGLLLTPTIDHLFDRGFISFEEAGRLIVSPVAHTESLRRMGIETEQPVSVGIFSQAQRAFLDYHRNLVLLRATLTVSITFSSGEEVRTKELRLSLIGL
jgi:putative restriction endonuclease